MKGDPGRNCDGRAAVHRLNGGRASMKGGFRGNRDLMSAPTATFTVSRPL